MKTLILAVLLLAAGWYLYGRRHKDELADRLKDTAAAEYAQEVREGVAEDIERLSEARGEAEEAVRKTAKRAENYLPR